MRLSANNFALSADKWFWRFILCHLILWTLVPAATHLNLPLDAMEGTTWGHQLELGYDKNPFLNAWVTALFMWLGQRTDWVIYFAGALCTCVCFKALYRLGCKFLNAWHALIAVMILEGMQYYTLSAMDLNDNILEIALWPLMALSFYNALQTQRWRDWLQVALWSALATMAKYYVIVILAPMLLLLVINKTARLSFIKPAFYGAISLYLALIAPHFIWLYLHDGITLDYALRKTAGDPAINPHSHYVVHFTLNYIGACVLPLLLFAIFYTGKSEPNITPARYNISSFTWQFIGLVGFGPFIVTLGLSAIFGWALNTGWGAPLPALWGLGLLAFAQPTITPARFYRFVGILVLLVGLCITIYSYSKITAGNTSSANYPGRMMAEQLTRSWHQRYHTKLSFVVGPRWEAGNIAYYSPDKPAVYMEWDLRVSPWIDEKVLKQKGAIFIWPAKSKWEMDIAELKQRFSDMEGLSLMHFSWQRQLLGKAEPLAVWVAYLPPKEIK
jgi:4-amino-4-deoxy-L-arabinose transferase-like glycosyltransferase